MRRSESGYVLFTVAALLFVLAGFTALAVDMGTILSSRTQIQRAADAAALAGAFSFTINQKSVQPDTAIVHATAIAQSNKVMQLRFADRSAGEPGRVDVLVLGESFEESSGFRIRIVVAGALVYRLAHDLHPRPLDNAGINRVAQVDRIEAAP